MEGGIGGWEGEGGEFFVLDSRKNNKLYNLCSD